MQTNRSLRGWLRQVFGGAPGTRVPPLKEAGQGTTGQPPLLLELCPAVGPDDNLTNNEWPEDPDAVPSWLIAREKRCLQIGIGPFRYRTRSEFERAIALCEAALEPKMHPAPVLAPQLPPAEAAKAFLTWLRTNAHTGEHTDAELRDLYAQHCIEANVVASPETTMRKFLAQLGGVTKVVKEAGKVGAHRKRGTVWIIKPSLAKVVAMQAAKAQPEAMRRAA